MNTTLEPISTDEPILVMSRTFDAPREIVWVAFTDPKHVAEWYGGYGFENPVCEMDVRPGGRWRHVMRTPDGTDYAMEFEFVEVVRPEKLVWRDAAKKRPTGGHASPTMTVTLEDLGAKTKWTLEARFESMADREAAMKMGFTHVLSEGTEKFNDVVKALSRS